jgi:orotidine-5'-phosphate decarboxylase
MYPMRFLYNSAAQAPLWRGAVPPQLPAGCISSSMASSALAPSRRTTVTNFSDQLAAAIRSRGNPVMVGLDPRAEQLPPDLLANSLLRSPERVAAAYREFCRGIIDVVAPLVPVVKPQAAFFEQLGPHGMTALADVIAYARESGLLVVLDGKRNDIGDTAIAYAEAYLGPQSGWKSDALTVSPYLGADSLEPFLKVIDQRGGGVFVLVKTSNPGGGMLQDVTAEGSTIYRRVAEYVEQAASARMGKCGYGSVGAVVGATYPEQLVELRDAMPHAWLLVPGYGTQGGTARDVVAAFDSQGLGAVINNSRGIIFAHARREYSSRFGPGRWLEAVEAATLDMIAQLKAELPTISPDAE